MDESKGFCDVWHAVPMRPGRRRIGTAGTPEPASMRGRRCRSPGSRPRSPVPASVPAPWSGCSGPGVERATRHRTRTRTRFCNSGVRLCSGTNSLCSFSRLMPLGRARHDRSCRWERQITLRGGAFLGKLTRECANRGRRPGPPSGCRSRRLTARHHRPSESLTVHPPRASIHLGCDLVTELRSHLP